jgi:F-type H+-transporting ATPase subunit epsilon
MKLEILSPVAVLFSGDVSSVQLPGSKDRGSLQILDNHAPLVSSLQPGKVTIKQGGTERVFVIKEGFVEVLNNRVAVLVDEAEEVSAQP